MAGASRKDPEAPATEFQEQEVGWKTVNQWSRKVPELRDRSFQTETAHLSFCPAQSMGKRLTRYVKCLNFRDRENILKASREGK